MTFALLQRGPLSARPDRLRLQIKKQFRLEITEAESETFLRKRNKVKNWKLRSGMSPSYNLLALSGISSVTRIDKTLPLCLDLLRSWQYFQVLISTWQFLTYSAKKSMLPTKQNLIDVNGQRWKNIQTIWSHWWYECTVLILAGRVVWVGGCITRHAKSGRKYSCSRQLPTKFNT